jgi:predicted phage terminase large subunit-like protein
MTESGSFNSDQPLSPRLRRALLDALVSVDMTAFICRSFEIVSPGEKFIFNWHLRAIAHALERVRRGEINRLIIAMPPRQLKSISVSVAFPAFLLGHDPTRKIIAASYSDALAAKHHNDCRALMRSEWYRRIFPATRMGSEKNTESEFLTTRRGGRYATSVGGTLTGRGGDLIIVDDPLKPEEAASESARMRVIQWFETTLLSRLNDKTHDAIIIVMQRLHVDDLAGHLLQKGSWELLELQAIAESRQAISVGPGQVHHRLEGDILHEQREPLAALESLKKAMGSFAFSAQYQQRPVPLEGNMIKRNWLKFYEAEPAAAPSDTFVISWDTANKATELANYSVATVWRVHKNNCYLADLVRGRFDFPDLKRAVTALKNRWPTATILIEDKGSGISLIQELRAQRISVIAINPESDKVTRLFTVQPMFEAGAVHLPKNADWLGGLIEELLAFPNFRSDDQVDSISQALTWIQKRRRALNGCDLGLPVSLPNDTGFAMENWTPQW